MFSFRIPLAVYIAAVLINIISCNTIIDSGVSNQCEENCQKSYPPHTYPNESETVACKRGCRFFVFEELSLTKEDAKGGINKIEACKASCVDAYNETSPLTNACSDGCAFQKMNSNMKTEQEGLKVHLWKPLMEIKEVASRVVGMFHIVKSSITTYLMNENKEVVAVQGPVHIMVDVIPEKEMEQESISGLESHAGLSGPNEFVASNDVTIEAKSPSYFQYRQYTFAYLIAVIVVATLLTCYCGISRNKKKVNLKLENDVLPPAPRTRWTIKVVRPEDLTKLSLMDEESGEAGSLPQKTKLPDSTI